MELVCSHCGNSAFKILRKRVGGSSYARCLKCDEEIDLVLEFEAAMASDKKKRQRRRVQIH